MDYFPLFRGGSSLDGLLASYQVDQPYYGPVGFPLSGLPRLQGQGVPVVDLGPQGASHGDMRVVNASVYNDSRTKRIGGLDFFCVSTDPADESAEKANMAECTYTYTLPGGEISV